MIRPFAAEDADAVIQLWTDCGLTRPWNDSRKDIARKLTTQPELFLVVEDATGLVASAMIGFDGHRGWISYLAVAPERRGEGHARALIARAELLLMERGCPKLMLMVRDENTAVIDLYRHLGYDLEPTRVMGKRLLRDQ